MTYKIKKFRIYNHITQFTYRSYTSKENKFHLVIQHTNTNYFTSQRSHTIKTPKLKVKGLQPNPHQN